MADALSLLFELDVDGRPAVAGLQRFRKDIAATIEATRRSLTQPLKSLNTAPITAAAKASASAQEREQRRLNAAVESLQRQRSAALIRAFKEEERAAVASSRAQERAAQQASRSIANAFRGIGPGLQSVGRTLTVGLTAPLLALGAASLKSAKDIDDNVNTLKAFTGSAEAAERRLAQLIKTSRDTPGLTTRLATTLDAQLRTAQVMEQTIDRVLPAIGRLNAVSKLPDAGRFTQNLLQLVTQNFEKQDLKELVGQSPLAGQLLTQIFNVDSPTNAKAIREQAKKLGLTSVDAFFAAFAEAAARNQGLATVTESISTRFDKIVDRVQVALRPLGLAILTSIEPFIEPVSKLIEQIGDAFNSLSPPVKTAIVVIAGLAAVVGPLLFVLGSIATSIAGIVTALGTIGAAVTAIGLPVIAAAVGAIVIVIGRWIAILGLLALAWKNNFLNIREHVSDAAGAVLQAFTRIKAVFDEATARILPTLQSITERVLRFITALWEQYGETVIKVISTSFAVVVRTLESFIRFFGNVVDLIAKLIDGDWRGAWRAFSRIIINALDSITEFFDKALPLIGRAFLTIHAFIIRQAVSFAAAATKLVSQFVLTMVANFIASAPQISDALAKMLLLAAVGVAVGPIGATLVAGVLDAMRKAAAEGVTVPVTASAQNVGADVGAGAGLFRPKKPPPPADGAGKGADAETRRRIRQLELEAERAEAIARQRIAAENIFFEQRKTSLQDFTDFQIKEEEIVLEKKKKVFAAERVEAEKLGKGRDLALSEIRLKELKAEIEFQDRRNQLLANQQREELEAAKAHRQALLDIQDEGDKKQLELIDSYVERYLLSFGDAEERRLTIEEKARERRKAELEIQLGEAGQNVQEQQRIKDAIAKLDAESATGKEDAESRKRRAIKATSEAEDAYFENLVRVTQATKELLRDAAGIELGRLASKFGDRRKFRLETLRLEREANEEQHQQRLRQIEQEKRDAEKRLEGVRDAEEKLIQLRRFYADLEKAENERRAAERREEQQKESDERDPFTPLRKRLQQFLFDLQNTNSSIVESMQSLSSQINASISAMVDAFGQAIAASALYGESIGRALKAALAQQLAAIAAEAAIQSLKHAAYALGSLAFGNFAAAAKHAAAAAAFAAVAGAAFVAARALSKSAGMFDRGKTSNTASTAVGGGQAQNREFQYGGEAVQPSSAAARDGSSAPRTGLGAAIAGLVKDVRDAVQANAVLSAKLDGTLSRIGSLPAGEVVTMGAADASLAIGAAVIQHSKENHDFSRDMATNMGL